MTAHDQYLIIPTALSEASAVAKNLGALERYSEAFINTDLPEAAAGPLKCLLHIICLIWANCPQYRRSSRLVTLLRQVSNLLIQQVRILHLVLIGRVLCDNGTFYILMKNIV